MADYTTNDFEIIRLDPVDRTNYDFDLLPFDVNQNQQFYTAKQNLEIFRDTKEIKNMFKSPEAFSTGLILIFTILIAIIVLIVFILILIYYLIGSSESSIKISSLISIMFYSIVLLLLLLLIYIIIIKIKKKIYTTSYSVVY